MDSVKQSAALCLLRLHRASPDLVPVGDWTSRVVHLLNDQHLVGASGPHPHSSAGPQPREQPCVTSRLLRGTSLAQSSSWESLQVEAGSPSPGVRADETGSLTHPVQALEGLLLAGCRDKQHSPACCRSAASAGPAEARLSAPRLGLSCGPGGSGTQPA